MQNSVPVETGINIDKKGGLIDFRVPVTSDPCEDKQITYDL
jgi:hypothetical protein